MANLSPTSRAIAATACSSLRLVSSSTGLLSLAQLFAIESEMCTSLALVRSQINAELSDDSKVVIDLTQCDGMSEGDDEDNGQSADATDADGGSERETHLPGVPGPYPMNPPKMDKLPQHWYVVSRGLEVGLFADVRNADFAIAGVAGGGYVKLNSWYDAAILYNELYHRGEVFRVDN